MRVTLEHGDKIAIFEGDHFEIENIRDVSSQARALDDPAHGWPAAELTGPCVLTVRLRYRAPEGAEYQIRAPIEAPENG